MSARRIAIISDEMEVAGSQRQIGQLLRHLDSRQWQADLAYFRNRSFLVDELERSGVSVHRIAKHHRVDPRFLRDLARFLRQGRFELVHCFSLTAELWTALALRMAPGAQLIASMRDMGHGLSTTQWRLKRLVCRSARAVISNSTGAAAALRQRIGTTPPVFVVANGVERPMPIGDTERLRLRSEMGARDGRALALFVGRLAHQKNVELLLAALAAVPAPRRPQLALAGSGPLNEALQAQARQLGLDAELRFLGARRDAPALMQAADLLVLPSRDEGLSNVVMEAMAAGCPVLATRVGGNAELVVDGISGLLVDSGDQLALSEALETLGNDAARRLAMSQAAQARIADCYSPTRLAAETEAVYRHCLEAR